MPVGKLQNRAIATFPLVLAVSVGFAGVAVCAVRDVDGAERQYREQGKKEREYRRKG